MANRRKKTKQPGEVEETDEQREERQKQRERETIGGGWGNVEWLGSIDNNGESLCLHSSASVQLIPKVKVYDTEVSVNDDTHQAFEGGEPIGKPEMQVVSEIHVFSGIKYVNHTKLQIGHICPDEILDLELDSYQELVYNAS